MIFTEVTVIKNEYKKKIENQFQHLIYSLNFEFRTG
jgi:hypothetical protein